MIHWSTIFETFEKRPTRNLSQMIEDNIREKNFATWAAIFAEKLFMSAFFRRKFDKVHKRRVSAPKIWGWLEKRPTRNLSQMIEDYNREKIFATWAAIFAEKLFMSAIFRRNVNKVKMVKTKCEMNVITKRGSAVIWVFTINIHPVSADTPFFRIPQTWASLFLKKWQNWPWNILKWFLSNSNYISLNYP